VSFVIIGAFAPQSVDETPPAGAAQLPLLLNPHPLGVPVPDPSEDFGDHSPDLLLNWIDHPFEGSEWIVHEEAAEVFADADDADLVLTGHIAASLVFTDHTPD
jgi:hypothetical protein